MIRATLAYVVLFVIPLGPYSASIKCPATILALGGFIKSPSTLQLSIVALAFCWDMAVDSVLFQRTLNRGREELLRAFVAFKDCSYEEIPLSQLLSQSEVAAMQSHSGYEFIGRRVGLWQHENSVRIFRMSSGESGVPQLRAYHLIYLKSYIFIRDLPADIISRFKLFHELGHSLGLQFAVQSMLGKGIKAPLIVLAVVFLGLSLTPMVFACYAVALIACWCATIMNESQKDLSTFFNEIEADQYALLLMSDAERKQLRHLNIGPLLKNSQMSGERNAARLRSFQEAADGFISGQPPTGPVSASTLGLMVFRFPMGCLLAGSLLLLGSRLQPVSANTLWLTGGLALLVFGWAIFIWWRAYFESMSYELLIDGALVWNGISFAFHAKPGTAWSPRFGHLMAECLNRRVRTAKTV